MLVHLFNNAIWPASLMMQIHVIGSSTSVTLVPLVFQSFLGEPPFFEGFHIYFQSYKDVVGLVPTSIIVVTGFIVVFEESFISIFNA